MQLNLRRAPYRTFSISQLCREFGATPRALRFYEEQNLLSPSRIDLTRVYSYRDRARLQLILRGRRVGLSIAQIRDILEAYDEDGEVVQSARALPIFRERLGALEAERRHVEDAIAKLSAAAERLSQKATEASASCAGLRSS